VLVGSAMFAYLLKLLLIARTRLKSRASLEAENLLLRQQVIVLSRKSRSRVRLRNIDRLIFVWLYRCFPAILNAITVVKPETVIRWHRRSFRAYWRWKSRRYGGRPRIDREIRKCIGSLLLVRDEQVRDRNTRHAADGIDTVEFQRIDHKMKPVGDGVRIHSVWHVKHLE
jgi:hypothetical protein